MKKISLKRDNRGASLLAVLILMVVVSAIAVVITKITIVNIQMKEVERGTKKNFYSADAVMDDLRTGARELAEKSLEKAYTDVLENYLTYTASGANAQDVFPENIWKIWRDSLQRHLRERQIRQMHPAMSCIRFRIITPIQSKDVSKKLPNRDVMLLQRIRSMNWITVRVPLH